MKQTCHLDLCRAAWFRVVAVLCAVLLLGMTVAQASHGHEPVRRTAAVLQAGQAAAMLDSGADVQPDEACALCALVHVAAFAPRIVALGEMRACAGPAVVRSQLPPQRVLPFELMSRPPPIAAS